MVIKDIGTDTDTQLSLMDKYNIKNQNISILNKKILKNLKIKKESIKSNINTPRSPGTRKSLIINELVEWSVGHRDISNQKVQRFEYNKQKSKTQLKVQSYRSGIRSEGLSNLNLKNMLSGKKKSLVSKKLYFTRFNCFRKQNSED